MRTLVFLLSITLLSTASTLAAQQRVGSAIGVRFGSPNAISAKHFFTEQAAVEVTAGFRPYLLQPYNHGFLGAAYLHHIPFDLGDSDFDALHWYVGGGGSIQFWNYDNDFFLGTIRVRDDFSSASIRISSYVGLQYALDEFPVEFTVDWSPSLTLGTTPFNSFRVGFYTLGVRYILK